MGKTCCIYHSIDLDGWMSAGIVKHWYEKQYKGNTIHNGDVIVDPNEGSHSLTFIGYNHGDPIPDISQYNKVILCDISLPKDKMYELYTNLGKNLIWIDHHVSSIKDNIEVLGGDLIEGLRDTKFAACELTWVFFLKDEPTPLIVKLLGLYDSFRHKGTNIEKHTLEFQYGARTIINNYNDANIWLNKTYASYPNHNSWSVQLNKLSDIFKFGNSVYKYLCTVAKETYNKGFEIELKEPHSSGVKKRKFICINQERFNPINFEIDYHKDNYAGAACFWYDNGKWHFSLYNNNGDVDCSVIAKQYGGGGHAGASGFVVDDINVII